MPHIVGLGGHPPERIDLQSEISLITAGKPIDANAMQRGVKRVNAHFDTDYLRMNDENMMTQGSLGPAAEKSLHARIVAQADKIVHGILPKTVDERRLAYAITAAYLDESGELDRRISDIQKRTEMAAAQTVVDPNQANLGTSVPSPISEVNQRQISFKPLTVEQVAAPSLKGLENHADITEIVKKLTAALAAEHPSAVVNQAGVKDMTKNDGWAR